jgi:hypothetical protein
VGGVEGWAMIGLLTDQVIAGQTRGLQINLIGRGGEGGRSKFVKWGKVLPHKVLYFQKL